MRYAHNWTIAYNGGVLRFTPEGQALQLVVWQTANLVTQQHNDAATFSAPTTDGRIAWLTIDRTGSIIGGGYHGATADTYVRCGVAMNGAAFVTPPPAIAQMRCQSGYMEFDNTGRPINNLTTAFPPASYDPRYGPMGTFSIGVDSGAPRTAPIDSITDVTVSGQPARRVSFIAGPGRYGGTFRYANYFLRGDQLVAYEFVNASAPQSVLGYRCGELNWE